MTEVKCTYEDNQMTVTIQEQMALCSKIFDSIVEHLPVYGAALAKIKVSRCLFFKLSTVVKALNLSIIFLISISVANCTIFHVIICDRDSMSK